MNTGLSSHNHLEDVSVHQRKCTTLMETKQTTDCPICYSFPNLSITENTELKLRFSERKCPVCGKYCGKPTLVDLFSGAGGAARGYQKAGFCVLGVDIKPQPHYAGCRFHQADALTYPLEGFDAYHASPPCQAYVDYNMKGKAQSKHPRLIEPTRDRLRTTGKAYIIENVIGHPYLHNALMLCGTMFDLRVFRHRYFETSFGMIFPPFSCNHWGKCSTGEFIGAYAYGAHGPRQADGYRGKPMPPKTTKTRALGIDWMNDLELNQAIPPAYTEYIGKYLMQQVMSEPRTSPQRFEGGRR